MSARVILPVLVIAVGLPAFIFYSLFSGDPRPEMRPIANFENYQKDITRLSNDRYQVLGVIDEGGLLRVNVWFQNPLSSRSEVRIQALNTLYDVQSLVGRKLSASVWIYRAPVAERSALQGLAFFRALTGQTVFKHADELP